QRRRTPSKGILNHSSPTLQPLRYKSKSMRWLQLILILMLIPLAGCALNGKPSTYLVQTKGPYTLDTGDVVRVTVYGEAEMSKSYRVDDAGAIALPLIGSIPVRGSTTQVAAARITAALA